MSHERPSHLTAVESLVDSCPWVTGATIVHTGKSYRVEPGVTYEIIPEQQTDPPPPSVGIKPMI